MCSGGLFGGGGRAPCGGERAPKSLDVGGGDRRIDCRSTRRQLFGDAAARRLEPCPPQRKR